MMMGIVVAVCPLFVGIGFGYDIIYCSLNPLQEGADVCYYWYLIIWHYWLHSLFN